MNIDFSIKGTEKVFCKENACDNPKISVIVTTYNHEKYIRDCMESILSQKTNFNFEILLGEDNSKDKTRDICIKYAEMHPEKISLFLHDRSNVIYIKGKPTGNYNFLFSLNKARGEYIAICEGDDYWLDNCKLQRQVDILEQDKKYSLCFHNVIEWYEASGKRNFLACNKKQKKITSLQDLLKGNYIPTCSVVFRNQKESKIPKWFIESIAGDWLLHLINSQYGNILYINEVMGVHRVHQGCTWASNEQLYNILDSLDIYSLIGKHFEPCKNEYRWDFLLGKADLIYQLACEYKKRKKNAQAYYFLVKSLIIKPGFSFLDTKEYIKFYKKNIS
jgi:glycosyltransferase involved in cell wall biosynthesis